MKKLHRILVCLLVLFVSVPVARPQGKAKQGPDVLRDADLEKDSQHNLEVARFYFSRLRKAYVSSLQRCEEIDAGNPTFSKIDEVLFIAGESSLRLAAAEGKQKPSQYVIHEGTEKKTLTADEFRDKAREYLSRLVNDYPASKFKSDALDDLKALGGPKSKESKP